MLRHDGQRDHVVEQINTQVRPLVGSELSPLSNTLILEMFDPKKAPLMQGNGSYRIRKGSISVILPVL